MKLVTRQIIGTTGLISTGVFLGTVGATVLKKTAETYCKTPGGQLAVYGIGSIGYLVIVKPIVENAVERLVDWVYKEEREKWAKEVTERADALLRKEEEET